MLADHFVKQKNLVLLWAWPVSQRKGSMLLQTSRKSTGRHSTKNMNTLEFKPFPKMARLRRDCIITEKIDGTNASIYIAKLPNDHPIPAHSLGVFDVGGEIHYMAAGSRTRWITPENDNFGFAAWVARNFIQLQELGEGHHFGEWWGSGIQRGYGFKNGERFFSLFNATRWVEHDKPTAPISSDNPKAPPVFQEHAPACCKVVPVLYDGLFSTFIAECELEILGAKGSVAAPKYMNPEGIVVYHKAAATGFKMTIKDDDKPKGQA